ncbi:hypothetical protein RGU70_14450 [Herbaspirillum sp. RTI4]|nr:hypothetical protein [Herbaspirillum sp. RTI4]MDY7579513.1 hypothetical protein [Herbaspirillum sp. RTI4]MEA9983141.1 hypothetical protein [Herbaspirillum sp. RTI4]
MSSNKNGLGAPKPSLAKEESSHFTVSLQNHSSKSRSGASTRDISSA